MFCDLVDSTLLIRRIGAEHYRAVNRSYRNLCSPIIDRYDGFISRYMGDGFLALFGYPQAHEDDAERAARAGLEIIKTISSAHFALDGQPEIRLEVRIGIATGLVVSGEVVGGGASEEHTVTGETPNLAARLQQIAAPNSVVVSPATRRLIRSSLALRPVGSHDFKGFGDSTEVFEVTGVSPPDTQNEERLTVGTSPLVARQRELALLRECWSKAKQGSGQVVLIQGEAGMGKSRLLWELGRTLAGQPHHWIECRCSPYLSNSALYPVIDMLRRECRITEQDGPTSIRQKLDSVYAQYAKMPEHLPTLAALMAPHGPEMVTHSHVQNHYLDAVVALLVSLSERKPVVFVVEDLHWVDPSTERLISLIVDQVAMTPIIGLVTARPEHQANWLQHSHTMHLTIGHLKPSEVEQFITGLTRQSPLSRSMLLQLVSKTDGVPLYVEELTRAVIEAGQHSTQTSEAGTATGTPISVPESLRDSLMARLDRLGSAKRLAQLASVLGRGFSYRHLESISDASHDSLAHDLLQLVRAELLYQHGVPPNSDYQFKHSLIQSTAYDSILTSKRREYHQRVAHALTHCFPEVDAANPELAARHFVLAGDAVSSLPRWSRAAQQALRRGIGLEAVEYSREGLSHIVGEAATAELARSEIELQTTLAAALTATYGFALPEVKEAYERAFRLCSNHDADARLVFPVLQGLHQVFLLGGPLTKAREIAEQLVEVANRGTRQFERRAEANRCLGWTQFCLGEFRSARDSVLHALTLYDKTRVEEITRLVVHDAGAAGLSNLGWISWFLGDVSEARKRSVEAVQHGREIDHPFSLAYALCVAAGTHQLRREPDAVSALTVEAISIADRHDFRYWSAWGRTLLGWSEFMLGEAESGIEKVREGLLRYRATESTLLTPYFLTLLAECQIRRGDLSDAEASLMEAWAVAERFEIRFYAAEILRLLAQTHQQRGNMQKAADYLQQALELSRKQSAISLELRALVFGLHTELLHGSRGLSLARLRDLLRDFDQDADTDEVRQARRLVEARGVSCRS